MPGNAGIVAAALRLVDGCADVYGDAQVSGFKFLDKFFHGLIVIEDGGDRRVSFDLSDYLLGIGLVIAAPMGRRV